MRRLESRVAIITGGAGGIGAATARRLHAEGARVVVADLDQRSAEQVAEAIGDGAIGLVFDAGNPESIRELIETTVARFGRLDILHNNAALTSPEVLARDSSAVEISFETWDAVLDVNLRGYLAGCKFAIPHMIAGGGGAIVNTASGAGIAGDVARIAYGTSKAGIIGLTRYIATQYGKQGVRCNAVSPGLVLTEALKSAAPELVSIIGRHTLTPRLGLPEDIAGVVAFLVSDDAAYITGENLRCDGGMLCHQPQFADVAALMAGGG